MATSADQRPSDYEQERASKRFRKLTVAVLHRSTGGSHTSRIGGRGCICKCDPGRRRRDAESHERHHEGASGRH